MRALLAALLLFVAPMLAMAQDEAAAPLPEQVAQLAIEEFIRPSFDALADASWRLEASVEILCDRPSPAVLDEARGAFLGTLDAFSRVSFLRFGPLARENRLERLLLWPDPRGIALRQVQEVLTEKPADALDAQLLARKSVALQGFNALEFVLFGSDSDDLAVISPDEYRCRYGEAVATAIRATAVGTAAEWQDPDGISARLISPIASDADYRSVREVLEVLVGALSHGAEGIRDTQLLPFLGRDGGDPRPRSAPLWRSDGTIVLVAGGLKGISDFVQFSGIAAAAGDQGRFIADAVAFEARNVARAEEIVSGTVEDALGDPRQLQGLRYLVILTQSLQALIGEQLSAALGLSVGFSSLDGD